MLDIGLVLLGLVVLISGGEALVRGASTVAQRAKLAPLVIGLVVVSAATSSPELAVTIGAVSEGEPGLAIGNVVGSNIANILLILGMAAMVSPLAIKRQLIRFDIPVMLGISVAFLAGSLDGRVTAIDGLILLGGLVLHAVMSIIISKREAAQASFVPAELPLNAKAIPLWAAILLIAVGVGVGVGALALGAQALVTGAVNIAQSLGVSSLIVGLTVVSVGTSLPELATSIVAVRRGERDMAVGNIVGSNIFNLGLVVGLPAMIFTDGIPVPGAAIALDIPLMLAASVALLPIAFTGFAVARWEGTLFFALYASYMVYLVLGASDHDALAGFTAAMLWFVLPLVAMTLVAITAYEVGLYRGKARSPAVAESDVERPSAE